MSYTSHKVGWPVSRYNDDKELHCVSCEEVFDTEAKARDQRTHYRNMITAPNSMIGNEHKILFRMHGLKRCLICNTNFSNLDLRTLFEHVKTAHSNENLYIWAIEGYTTYVRTFASSFPDDTQDQKDERKENFKAVYTRLEISLKQQPFWTPFKDFMGCRNTQLGSTQLWYEVLQPLLTDYKADFFYPIHPDHFLSDRQYDEDIM